MLNNLLTHEMKSLLKSKRVIWSISIFLILYALIFQLRVKDFNIRQQNYINDVEQVKNENKDIENYSFLGVDVVRLPRLTSIFHEGHTHTFGTFIKVMLFDKISEAYDNSAAANQVYKYPLRMDITYLITFFMSLFVLIISFDTVNGEKEAGTLKVLFVYPIKRIHFVLKKIIGNLLFITIVFGVPYILSLIYLLIAFNNYFNAEFMQFAFVYFAYTLIYLFVISLMGILFSTLTQSSARSLIFVLVFWISFSIIIPICYNLLSTKLDQPQKTKSLNEKSNLLSIKINDHLQNVPDEINPDEYSHWNWNGGYENSVSVYGSKRMYKGHIGYLKYYNQNIMPVIREQEQINLELLRCSYNHERLLPFIMFFNPNVLFENAVESVSMTSYKDHISYLSDAISIRDDFIDTGIKDKWLFSLNTICTFDTSATVVDFEGFILDEVSDTFIRQNYPAFNTDLQGREKLLQFIMQEYSQNRISPAIERTAIEYKSFQAKSDDALIPLKLEPLSLPEYHNQPQQISDIIRKTYFNLILLSLISIFLLLMINNRFSKFDLR